MSQYGYPPQQPPPPGYPPGGYQPTFAQQPPPPAPPPREPRKYAYLPAIILCTFSKDLWRDVGQRWRGIGLLYMLLVLLLTWVIVGIKFHVGFSKFIRDEAPKFIQKVPDIHITDGVVSDDVEQPHVINNPDNNQPFIIIDTTGETTAPPPNPPSVLLTRDKLIFRKDANQIQEHDLSKIESFHLTQQELNVWAEAARRWLIPLFVATMVIFSLLGRLILMLIFGGIATAMASSDRTRLDFPGGMRLAAIAMTPAILLSTLTTLLNIPGFGCFDLLISIGLTFVYLYLAVQANARDNIAPGGFGYTPPPPPSQPIV